MIKINLLPKKVHKKREVNTELLLMVGALCCSIGISGGLYVKNESDIKQLTRDIVAVRTQLNSMKTVYAEFSALEKEKKEMATKVSAVDRIKEGRAVATRLLYDLSSLTKDSLWLKKLQKNEAKLTLEGRSVDNESICEFVERLSKLQYLSNVELRSVEDVTEAGFPVKKFNIDGNVGL
jgi:Tfp pilus assembly protein PilN